VLTLPECTEIESGLDAVARRLEQGEAPTASDEDVHTLIDRLLHEEIGDTASKLHTGRSRNDQVATASRMWAMDAAGRLDAAVRSLQHVMIDQAHGLETALMPAYTHLQRAQPVSRLANAVGDRVRLELSSRGLQTTELSEGAAEQPSAELPGKKG